MLLGMLKYVSYVSSPHLILQCPSYINVKEAWATLNFVSIVNDLYTFMNESCLFVVI